MYDPILLTLDGSELAEQAIPHAATVAKATGSRLIVLRVVPPIILQADPAGGEFIDPGTYQELVDAEMGDAKSYVDGQVDVLRQQGIDSEGVVLLGTPPTAIMEEATERDAKLIVLATHGRSGIARAVLGSVADHLVRHASVPVLLVRAQHDEQSAHEGNTTGS